MGGWGRPNDYVITYELGCLLVMIDYRLGGWVKNDQDFDYVIFEWPLSEHACLPKTTVNFYTFGLKKHAINQFFKSK